MPVKEEPGPQLYTLTLALNTIISTVLCWAQLRQSNSATLWTAAHQAPLSMGFSRQEYWSGLSRPPPGRDALLPFPDPGIEPESLLSPALQTDSLPLSHQGSAQGSNCPQNQGGGTISPIFS